MIVVEDSQKYVTTPLHVRVCNSPCSPYPCARNARELVGIWRLRDGFLGAVGQVHRHWRELSLHPVTLFQGVPVDQGQRALHVRGTALNQHRRRVLYALHILDHFHLFIVFSTCMSAQNSDFLLSAEHMWDCGSTRTLSLGARAHAAPTTISASPPPRTLSVSCSRPGDCNAPTTTYS